MSIRDRRRREEKEGKGRRRKEKKREGRRRRRKEGRKEGKTEGKKDGRREGNGQDSDNHCNLHTDVGELQKHTTNLQEHTGTYEGVGWFANTPHYLCVL